MLTERTIDAIARFIKLGSKACVLPFRWNSISSSVEIGTKKQRAIFTIVMVYLYWEAAYQGYHVVIDRGNKSVPLTKYMKLAELFATRLTALLLQTITFVYHEEVKDFANQLMHMNARFMKINRHNHVRDPCAKSIPRWYWFVIIHPAITAAIYAGNNKEKRYWHGALLPSEIQPCLVPLFTAVEYWISLFSELGSAYAVIFLFAYCKSVPLWVQELGTMARKRNKHAQVISMYRGLFILNRTCNNACSLMTACGVLALLADLTILVTCTLRVSPVIGFPRGLHFPIAALALILVFESTIRPAANFKNPSCEFLAEFSEIYSGKRSFSQRRGHVKNMEKERKKVMKVKRYDYPSRRDSISHSAVPAGRSACIPQGDGRHYGASLVSEIDSQLPSHFKIKRRNKASENDIEVIGMEDLSVVVAVPPERKTSLELIATAKSMYPLVADCFIFFQFEKSTIFDFYNTVLDQTISALLVT